MNTITSLALTGCLGLTLLAGCGKNEDVAPTLVGKWEETGQTLTTYNAQNQVQSARLSDVYNGQLLTFRTDGTFEHITRFSGTVTGTYTYSGGLIVATWPTGSSTTGSSTHNVLDVSATALRVQNEFVGGPARMVVETRYVRK